MKHILKSLSVLLLLGWLPFCGDLRAQEVVSDSLISGHWKLSETYHSDAGDQNIVWSFELLDDKSPTIIAVGRRFEANGKRTRDRSVAIVFIDKLSDGGLRGSYIEAFGDGEQIELALNIEKSRDGKTLKMNAVDRENRVVSEFEGEWLGSGLKSNFQSGKWDVREIVSPGKGGWDIQWSYTFSEAGGKISGKGNKVKVNDRDAYAGEKKTTCRVSLKRIAENADSIKGTGAETNNRGKTSKSSYEGWLSPSGRTFFLMSYDSDGLAALIVGRYAR